MDALGIFNRMAASGGLETSRYEQMGPAVPFALDMEDAAHYLVRMAIEINYATATEILYDEAKRARSGETTPLMEAWRARVTHLGVLCPYRRGSTNVAILGTAMLAKATDARVEVYSLLERDPSPNAYSARTLIDVVMAKHRVALNLDLGVNGPNPMNNAPYLNKANINEITTSNSKAGWPYFLECMKELKALKGSAEAREALRGFIAARTKGVLEPIKVDPRAGDHLSPSALLKLITEFVQESSEGGRRAQSCVAAFLDAAYGFEHVIVGVINDPDRRAPLDVSVLKGEKFVVAFEVKDKPLDDSQIFSSIEKTVANHGLRNLAFVAVAKQQRQTNFDDAVKWAAERGVKITVFADWTSLYNAIKWAAPQDNSVFEGVVFRRILDRATEMGVNAERLKAFKASGELEIKPKLAGGQILF